MFSRVILPFFILIVLVSSYENCSVPFQPNATKGFPILEPYSFNDTFEVVELDNTTDAVCLDGTNYKFWFKRGHGSGLNKWMFNWQGAAFCGADGINILESCLTRSLGEYGSSNSLGDNGTIINSSVAWGYFSSLKDFNPMFYNWNKVFYLSCDGANHQGYLKEPVVYRDTKLWFRGFNNTMSTMEYLRTRYGLFNATEIILSGGSSGGLATYPWMSYLQHYFPQNTKLMGLPDAGFFIDTYDDEAHCHLFRYLIQQLTQFVESQNNPLYQYCRYYGTEEIWKCLIPQYIVDDIEIPVFISNSQVDYEQLTNLNGVECIMNGSPTSCTAKDKKTIIKVREYFLARIFEIKEKKPKWGYFLRTCFEHTYCFTWAWYGTSMNVFNAEQGKEGSLREAFYEWYNNGTVREKSISSYIDLIDWLHNPMCHY